MHMTTILELVKAPVERKARVVPGFLLGHQCRLTLCAFTDESISCVQV